MKTVRIGARRLYDSIGCSLANQQPFNLVFPFGDHLQAEIYMGNKPKFGIFTNTGHEDFAFPSTEIDFGHTTYHGDATQSPHPRTFFTEIVCSQAEIVTDELFDMFSREDQKASHELLSRAEKHAEEYHTVADLLSGIIGLRFHSQFVIKLLNEGFVAFHDKIHAVNNFGSLIAVLKSVKINQPSVDTISQIFPAIGQLKVKEAERDSKILGWLIRAWAEGDIAERDIIAKFNALFIPLEMILDDVSGTLSADLSAHIQALQDFIQAQGGEETERLSNSLKEVVSKIRPSLIDRFNTFADQAKMPGYENDKEAFKLFNRIRNGLLHRGDPNVRIHVPVGEEVKALEDLTERYVNYYLFGDTNVYQSSFLSRPKPPAS